MTDVPTYGKKNLADIVAIYGRGRELLRPPTSIEPSNWLAAFNLLLFDV